MALVSPLLRAFALTCLLFGTAFAGEPRTPASIFSLNMGDLRAEAADARADGRKAILLVFEQEGCPYCAHMRSHIFTNKAVKDYYTKHFVALPIDLFSSVPLRDFAGREHTEKSFAQSLKIRVTPSFVFYDLGGNEIARYAGGMKTPEEFLQLGAYVADGAYRDRPFNQYKSERSKGK